MQIIADYKQPNAIFLDSKNFGPGLTAYIIQNFLSYINDLMLIFFKNWKILKIARSVIELCIQNVQRINQGFKI